MKVCSACKENTRHTQYDHRIPRRVGGVEERPGSMRGADNIQVLCLVCHQRKTTLEKELFSLYCSDECVYEWYQLAFQNDAKRIEEFHRHLSERVTHFKKIGSVLSGVGWYAKHDGTGDIVVGSAQPWRSLGDFLDELEAKKVK